MSTFHTPTLIALIRLTADGNYQATSQIINSLPAATVRILLAAAVGTIVGDIDAETGDNEQHRDTIIQAMGLAVAQLEGQQ